MPNRARCNSQNAVIQAFSYMTHRMLSSNDPPATGVCMHDGEELNPPKSEPYRLHTIWALTKKLNKQDNFL